VGVKKARKIKGNAVDKTKRDPSSSVSDQVKDGRKRWYMGYKRMVKSVTEESKRQNKFLV